MAPLLLGRIGGDASTVQKKNESIVINNDITVTVVEIRGDKVRLGIVAPKEVPVHRQEVYDAIHGKPGAEPAPSTVAPSRWTSAAGRPESTLGINAYPLLLTPRGRGFFCAPL